MERTPKTLSEAYADNKDITLWTGRQMMMLTDLGDIYRETYNRLVQYADENYMTGWNVFSFERVAAELIPEMINFQVENHSPYGAYDTRMIELIVGCYLPKISKSDRSNVWFVAHETLWSELYHSREKLQRLAYHIEGHALYHFKVNM